jgi:hypothetical protein
LDFLALEIHGMFLYRVVIINGTFDGGRKKVVVMTDEQEEDGNGMSYEVNFGTFYY